MSLFDTFRPIARSISTSRSNLVVNRTSLFVNETMFNFNSEALRSMAEEEIASDVSTEVADTRSMIRTSIGTSIRSDVETEAVIGRAEGSLRESIIPESRLDSIETGSIEATSGDFGGLPTGVGGLPTGFSSRVSPISPLTRSFSFFGDITPEEEATTSEATSRPSTSVLEEENLGLRLKEEEKPKIVAMLGENINSSGFPTQNTIIIKKINSNKYLIKKLDILRKNIFDETSYTTIASLTGGQLILHGRLYKFVKKKLKLEPKQLISYVDTSITSNKVYAYKISVEYDLLSDRQIEENNRFENFVESFGPVISDIGPGGFGFRI